MAKLIVDDGTQKRAFAIKKGRLFMGTADACALKLQGEGVAEKHCRLALEDETWVLRDLGGAAGTKVNGEPIDEVELEPGDVIELPGMTIEFQAADESGASSSPPSSAASTPSRGVRGSGRTRKSGGRSRSRGLGESRSPSAAPGERDDLPRLTRSRPKASAIPGWAMGLFAVSGAAIIIMLGIMLFNKKAQSIGPTGTMRQAQDLFYEEKFAEAREVVSRIGDDAGEPWVSKRDELLEMIGERDGLSERLTDERAAGNAYQSIQTYRSLKLQENGQDIEDPAIARYFVEYWLNHYLERFPDGENAAEIRRLVSIYAEQYDESDPYPVTWHEVRTIWEGEIRPSRRRYGKAYRVMDEYARANPEGEQHDAAISSRERAVQLAGEYLDKELGIAESSIASGSFENAMGRLNRCMEFCGNIPGAEERIQALIDKANTEFQRSQG